MQPAKMGFLLFSFFLDGLFLFTAASNVHHYSFILDEKNFTRLCTTKSMLVVNGQFPGPAIHVRRGDTAFVNVHNNGKYGVTIHWHGVKQPRNPWSDGPENITQCPIQPGKNFTYEVIFSTEEGTLWYHAHSDWTRATVHGPIVILPPIGKSYPFPKPYKEETIVLASWFNGDVKQLIDVALATGGEPNISDAFTLNGWPGALYNCSNEKTYTLEVQKGKTYLLRLVNAVMNEEHFLAIAKHNLTVVAQDAAYIKPLTTSYILIAPGQTMDILVTANQKPSHYYMFARPFFYSSSPFDNTTTSAILRYTDNYIPPLTPLTPIQLPAIDARLKAFNFTSRVRALVTKDYPINVPKNITERLYITIAVNTIICPNANCSGPSNNRLAASMNNVSFDFPDTDVLQAYYRQLSGVYTTDFPPRPPYFFNFSGDVGNNTLHPDQGTKVRVIEWGAEVEMVFQGTNILLAENHPMHLHGFSFYNVGNGFGNYNFTSSPKTYNLVDPPEVNTVGVPKTGWVAVRFKADNPGVWFIHCHLERHLSWGMDAVIIVKNGPTKETSMKKPPPNMPKCS
ncbi:hypothetical protein UlMin_036265 [Ulmus minor]